MFVLVGDNRIYTLAVFVVIVYDINIWKKTELWRLLKH